VGLLPPLPSVSPPPPLERIQAAGGLPRLQEAGLLPQLLSMPQPTPLLEHIEAY
jgi:hypothetical protein